MSCSRSISTVFRLAAPSFSEGATARSTRFFSEEAPAPPVASFFSQVEHFAAFFHVQAEGCDHLLGGRGEDGQPGIAESQPRSPAVIV